METCIHQTETQDTLSKLAEEISDLNENRSIKAEYLKAIHSKDHERLAYFATFGKTPRHRILNIDSYRHALQFGFTEMIFNKSGWLANTPWTVKEEIAFPVDKEVNCYNHVDIACGLNGQWTYGVSYQCSCSGGCYAPNEFCKPYPSKESCIDAAINELKSRLQELIAGATTKSNTTNHKIDYLKRVITSIDAKMASKQQLALF